MAVALFPYVQKLHVQEIDSDSEFAEKCKEAARKYEALLGQIERTNEVLKVRLNGIEADQHYRCALEEMQKLAPEPITRAQLTSYQGRLTKSFRELDNAFSEEMNRPLHRYCGCHVLEQGVAAKDQMKMESPHLRPVKTEIASPVRLFEFAWDFAKGIPLIGRVAQLVEYVVTKIFKAFPVFIQKTIAFTAFVVTYIPFKLLSLLHYLVILLPFGATHADPVLLTKYHIEYPSNLEISPELKGKSVANYSWSYGGGHDAVQMALGQRYAEAGMHVYNVRADEELLEFDPLWVASHKIGGFFGRKGVTTCELFNCLMRNNYGKTLKLLSWLFSGSHDPNRAARIDAMAATMLARGVPDAVVTCFSRYAGCFETAAGRIGLPMINMSTDLDSKIFDLEDASEVKNLHFKHGLVVRDRQLENRLALLPKRVIDVGLPVREAFLKNYSAAEVDGFRQVWNVAADRRVIVLLGGRDGVANQCAEKITREYRGEKKIHLFVVCGTNASAEKNLKQTIQGPHVTILGWTEEKKVAQLAAMAGDPRQRGGIVSAKGGGGTLMEAIAMGVPMLVSDRNGMEWERENIGFMERQRLAVVFKDDAEVAEKLEDLLHLRFVPYNCGDSKKKSLDALRLVIRDAERDQHFQEIRNRSLSLQIEPAPNVRAQPRPG